MPTMRELVRRSVAERVPIDDSETAMIERFLTHFDALTEPFSEDADPVHVTGSVIVLGPRGVILLKHRRLGLWLQPGGHVEAGESPWQAAAREGHEETGLEMELVDRELDVPRPVHVDVHPGGRGHVHLDLRYLARAGTADPRPPAAESQEIGWFDWPDAIERAGDERLTALLTHLSGGAAI